jgi:hypothetical protein
LLDELERVLARRGVPARRRADGRVSVLYQNQRLDAHGLPGGRLVLEVPVAQLPAGGPARSAMLEHALRVSTAQMRIRHDTLCLLPGGTDLVLQCELSPPMELLALEDAFTAFLDAIDRWTTALTDPDPRDRPARARITP